MDVHLSDHLGGVFKYGMRSRTMYHEHAELYGKPIMLKVAKAGIFQSVRPVLQRRGK